MNRIEKEGRMRKVSYEAYANQAFRFYARNDSIKLPASAKEQAISSIDVLNWTVCHEVLSSLDDRQKAAILDVYRRVGSVQENVAYAAATHNMPENKLWQLLSSTSKLFAKSRGLL